MDKYLSPDGQREGIVLSKHCFLSYLFTIYYIPVLMLKTFVPVG